MPTNFLLHPGDFRPGDVIEDRATRQRGLVRSVRRLGAAVASAATASVVITVYFTKTGLLRQYSGSALQHLDLVVANLGMTRPGEVAADPRLRGTDLRPTGVRLAEEEAVIAGVRAHNTTVSHANAPTTAQNANTVDRLWDRFRGTTTGEKVAEQAKHLFNQTDKHYHRVTQSARGVISDATGIKIAAHTTVPGIRVTASPVPVHTLDHINQQRLEGLRVVNAKLSELGHVDPIRQDLFQVVDNQLARVYGAAEMAPEGLRTLLLRGLSFRDKGEGSRATDLFTGRSWGLNPFTKDEVEADLKGDFVSNQLAKRADLEFEAAYRRLDQGS